MYQKIKGSLAVLLIGFIIYNSIGYVLVVPFWQIIHRQNTYASLATVDRNKLVEIIVVTNDASIIYKNGKRELFHDGMMYDIVLSRESGNRTYLLCLPDLKENRMLSMTEKMHKKHPGAQDSSPFSRIIIEKIIKSAVCCSEDPSANFAPGLTVPWQYLSLTYKDPSIQVPEHPPCSLIL